MHVGRRVAKLRAAHGESLRDAAVRTGVSHTTIARIEKGEVTGSFHSTLRKIAEGYGVRTEFLLTGRDPRQDFEQAIRRLSPEERSQLYFASVRTRVKMVIDFLMAEYPNEFSFEGLTEAIGEEGKSFQQLLDRWHAEELPEEANIKLAEALSRITGISHHWFRWGVSGSSDQVEILPREMLTAYVNLIKKAAQHGVQPQMLDMAIDLLIMKNKDAKETRQTVS
ncbi:MAG TPA: helix-turn-helix transcriptional regulator [Symbiobacteriaceae bacterium]|nr:helix-turn-helix transcriptional regulator [Symbiobacteriaceae bacterium]